MNLKVTDYAGYIEVYVNDQIINMQPNYDSTPYGYGRFAPDLPTSGEVPVTSLGQLYLKAQAPTGAVSAKVKLQTVGSSAGVGVGSVFFDDASLFELP